MIRLGLRLALSGGRGAAIGLALTAFAVAVGTAILLFALSFLPALDDRAQRAAWRTSFVLSETGTSEGAGLLIRSDVDSYAGEPLVRVLVAGLVDAPPTPPGVDRVPRTRTGRRLAGARRAHADACRPTSSATGSGRSSGRRRRGPALARTSSSR